MVSRDNSRSGFAPLGQQMSQPGVESAFDFGVLTVTMPAVSLQDRPYVGFEGDAARRAFGSVDGIGRSSDHDAKLQRGRYEHPRQGSQHGVTAR
jgi:hypothetical protein